MSNVTNPDQRPLELKSVQSILDEKFEFYVPAYQRGYRWRKEEVKQLIDDLERFQTEEKEREGKKCPFYCLQATIVKAQDGKLEVIDGQQRLTTILILLQALYTVREIKSLTRDFEELVKHDLDRDEWIDPYRFTIKYATRTSSEQWLKEITIAYFTDRQNDNNKECEKLMKKNSDYYHFVKAYQAALDVFLPKIDDELWRGNFKNVLTKQTRFIWYNTSLAETKDSEVDIFDRINATKIELNNAELIKALFLQIDNYGEQTQKRDQLAIDWDRIEKRLQNKSFWGFVYSSNHPYTYVTHIEYIFDLIKNKTEADRDYDRFTFNKYYEEFPSKQDERLDYVEKCWKKVQEMMLTLEEWYNDRTCYHYVGYLLEYGKEQENPDKAIAIPYLVEKLTDITKDQRKQKLIDLISFSLKNLEPKQLFHGVPDNKVTQVLFLLNIQTEENRKSETARFSFSSYKQIKEKPEWNEEHVASNTDYEPKYAEKDGLAFAILEYFTGVREKKEIQQYKNEVQNQLNNAPNGISNICHELLDFFDFPDDENETDFEKIKKAYAKVLDFFKTSDDAFNDEVDVEGSRAKRNEKDFIWNFALLNATTNKSYGNDIYPLKRKRIMSDEYYIYTPVCTRGMFEKAYSHNLTNLMAWTRSDAIDFWQYLCSCLSQFLPKDFDLPFKL